MISKLDLMKDNCNEADQNWTEILSAVGNRLERRPARNSDNFERIPPTNSAEAAGRIYFQRSTAVLARR